MPSGPTFALGVPEARFGQRAISPPLASQDLELCGYEVLYRVDHGGLQLEQS